MRQLEIFCAVMRSRTTVAAAYELGLSQPAVSNAIKHLEDNLGFTLFNRVGNRLLPTLEGKAVYQDAQPLQTMANGLRRRLSDLRDTKRGHLRILATRPLGDSFLPRVIKQFSKDRDNVHIYYDVQHLDGVVEAVESGFADLGIALEPPPRPSLEIQTIAEGRMVCAVPLDHTLAQKPVLGPEDLTGTTIIGSEPVSRLGAAVARAVHERSVPYAPNISVLQGVIACALVSNGIGVAIVDEFSGAQWQKRGVVLVPFEPAIVVVASIMTLVDRPLSRLARRFVQIASSTPR
ncbi:MAG: LysR substrate-binding domain-containing protein [Pseudolabrys sp.]